MTDTAATIALNKYLKNLNPAIDTNDPIVKDLAVNFGTQIISDVQTRVSYLNSRYTNAFLNQLTDNELAIYAYNSEGMVRGSGKSVTGYVYFMFTAADDSGVVSIPTNTTVGTTDGSWLYVTTQPIYITTSSLPSFYNAVRNCYELRVPVSAVKPGIDYRAAAYRITQLYSSLSFSVKVENREPFTDGADPESREDFITRINNAKAGFNQNSTSGIRDGIISNTTGLQDVQFQHSPGYRNTYDLYYIGYQPVAEVMEYSVTNPSNREIKFSQSKTPVRYVDGVIVDGVTISPSLYRTTPTKLLLHSSVALTSSSKMSISFQYNSLNSDIKAFLESEIDFPGAVWNVNEGTPNYLSVKVKAKPQTFTDLSDVAIQIEDLLLEYLNPGQFVVGYQAGDIKSFLLDALPYLMDCAVSINDLPFINFNQGEYPVLTSDNLTIDSM